MPRALCYAHVPSPHSKRMPRGSHPQWSARRHVLTVSANKHAPARRHPHAPHGPNRGVRATVDPRAPEKQSGCSTPRSNPWGCRARRNGHHGPPMRSTATGATAYQHTRASCPWPTRRSTPSNGGGRHLPRSNRGYTNTRVGNEKLHTHTPHSSSDLSTTAAGRSGCARQTGIQPAQSHNARATVAAHTHAHSSLHRHGGTALLLARNQPARRHQGRRCADSALHTR